MSKKKYIPIFGAAIILMIVAVCVYINMLSHTVAGNLMSSVDEISSHDVESIEGALDNSYARLGSIAKRMRVYDVHTIKDAQEQMNLEAASSALFNAIYMLDDKGHLYSSSYLRLDPGKHAYDEMFKDGRKQFVMLYDDSFGNLETTKESLIYGISLENMNIGGHRLIAMLGRSELSTIRDQLLIESFNGEGISSVVNDQGYYIVSASPATDLAGRNNFYDMLKAGSIDDGVTIEDVRKNISEGKSFVVNCTKVSGERLVLSFAPIEGTTWSFILAVPMQVFEQQNAPFIVMTAVMLGVVVVVLLVMMLLIYRFMKRTISANAESAARAEFLSNMSHEIRTPLNGIIGLNHLMASNLDDQQAMKEYVYKLGNAAQYLLSLVNDILDVSKLQAGKVDLSNEPFDLGIVLDNVIEMQRETIEKNGIDFVTEVSPLHYPYLVGDDVRMSQILMNVLSNAAKFTPEKGRITIKSRQALLPGDREVTTLISIEDTGCGMTKEFQKHIFDVFTQERNSNSESQKGTGLGMAISAMLASQMGGSLTVESELGKGSCFMLEVTLSIDPDFATPLKIENVPESDGALETISDGLRDSLSRPSHGEDFPDEDNEPISILVAEDNELNSDILSAILERNGYVVDLAVNGEEAVEAFSKSGIGEYTAILMDAQMPVMDGYEAAKRIRQLDRADAQTVRIFACTASTFAEDRRRALDSGMNDFLAKPLDVPDMLKKLENAKKDLRR